MPETLLLLDTHILIWMINGDSHLNLASRKAINSAAVSGSVLISAITVWEIAMLVRSKRVQISKSIQSWVDDMLAAPGIVLAPLSPEVAVESCNLPGQFHGDPADRIIVATARNQGATLFSKDKQIVAYGKEGHVRLLEP